MIRGIFAQTFSQFGLFISRFHFSNASAIPNFKKLIYVSVHVGAGSWLQDVPAQTAYPNWWHSNLFIPICFIFFFHLFGFYSAWVIIFILFSVMFYTFHVSLDESLLGFFCIDPLFSSGPFISLVLKFPRPLCVLIICLGE